MSERQSKSDFHWQHLQHSAAAVQQRCMFAPTRRLRVGAVRVHCLVRFGYN